MKGNNQSIVSASQKENIQVVARTTRGKTRSALADKVKERLAEQICKEAEPSRRKQGETCRQTQGEARRNLQTNSRRGSLLSVNRQDKKRTDCMRSTPKQRHQHQQDHHQHLTTPITRMPLQQRVDAQLQKRPLPLPPPGSRLRRRLRRRRLRRRLAGRIRQVAGPLPLPDDRDVVHARVVGDRRRGDVVDRLAVELHRDQLLV